MSALTWRFDGQQHEAEDDGYTLRVEADDHAWAWRVGYEAHRLAHKLRDPKFYTARTKRAVNSGGAL